MKKCWRICCLRRKRLEKRSSEAFDTTEVLHPPDSTLKGVRSNSKYMQTTTREEHLENSAERKRGTGIDEEEGYFNRVPSMYTPHSYYIFSYHNLLRRIAFKLAEEPKYNTLVDIFALVGTFKILAHCFMDRMVTGEDVYDYFWGYLLVMDLSLRTIAYGLISDKNAFLFRDQVNIIYLILTILFFSKSLYFIQVLHIFRIFSLLNRAKLLQSASEVLKIIRASTPTLAVLVAFYLLLLLVFSLYSWILFSDSMGSFCFPIEVASYDISKLNFPEDLCTVDSDCKDGKYCDYIDFYMMNAGVTRGITKQGNILSETFIGSYGLMNFRNFEYSFYLNFLIGCIENLTDITTELNRSGGQMASTFYILFNALLFGFIIKSFFVGILYDVILKIKEISRIEMPTFFDKADTMGMIAAFTLKPKGFLGNMSSSCISPMTGASSVRAGKLVVKP
jgi:hypothetical protein